MMEDFSNVEAWDDYLTKIKEDLKQNNQELYKYIIGQARKLSPNFSHEAFEAMIGVVAVIERQAEADKMEEIYPTKALPEA